MRLFFLMFLMVQPPSFKATQLKQGRVKIAYAQKESLIQSLFKSAKLEYHEFNLFIRAFKKEQTLEVWVREKNQETFTLLHAYKFCTSSGTLGPKRKEGDLQIPEGIYHINHFNPQSNFHLSLGLNYPNTSDKILSDKQYPGGSIYIHGNCVTIGCIPITDDKIKELYILAVEARNNGQTKIPVHIYPARLTDNGIAFLKENYNASGHTKFWENLKTVYDDFEQSKKLKPVNVTTAGLYTLK
jgi:murein L,D-transpeptidase YafK